MIGIIDGNIKTEVLSDGSLVFIFAIQCCDMTTFAFQTHIYYYKMKHRKTQSEEDDYKCSTECLITQELCNNVI